LHDLTLTFDALRFQQQRTAACCPLAAAGTVNETSTGAHRQLPSRATGRAVEHPAGQASLTWINSRDDGRTNVDTLVIPGPLRRRLEMQEADIHEFARQLMDAHGTRSVAEAAQKARALEEQGDNDEARTWRRIEAALKLMRGPHQS
jgi:hypothetical protein